MVHSRLPADRWWLYVFTARREKAVLLRERSSGLRLSIKSDCFRHGVQFIDLSSCSEEILIVYPAWENTLG